jgi:hypothetical protein
LTVVSDLRSGGGLGPVSVAATSGHATFWVRNARLPITKVDVQSTNHPSFTELSIGDAGDGTFTLRVTAVDGQVITDTFPSFTPGGALWSAGNFQWRDASLPRIDLEHGAAPR